MIRRSALLSAAMAMAVAGCGSGAADSTAEPAGDVTTTARSLVTTASAGEVPSSTTVEQQQGVAGVFAADEVIRFEAGGTSATISDAVVLGERNRYTLEAAAGQTMVITLTSVEDNAVFDLFGPTDELLVSEATAESVVLPSAGVYTLILGGTRGNASYELTVEIPVS